MKCHLFSHTFQPFQYFRMPPIITLILPVGLQRQVWAIIYLYDGNRHKLSTENPPPASPSPPQATNILSCPAHVWISAGGRVCWPLQPGWLPRQRFPKIFLWFTKYFPSSITRDFQSWAVTTRSAWWLPQALFSLSLSHTHTHSSGRVAFDLGHDCVVLPPTAWKWNCVNNWAVLKTGDRTNFTKEFNLFSCAGAYCPRQSDLCFFFIYFFNKKPAFFYIIKTVVKMISSPPQID